MARQQSIIVYLKPEFLESLNEMIGHLNYSIKTGLLTTPDALGVLRDFVNENRAGIEITSI